MHKALGSIPSTAQTGNGQYIPVIPALGRQKNREFRVILMLHNELEGNLTVIKNKTNFQFTFLYTLVDEMSYLSLSGSCLLSSLSRM